MLAIPAVLITGISKGGFAGGAGNMMMPLMALSVPAPIAAGIALPLLCAMDVSGLRAWWGKWDKREMRVLIPGALVGILAGGLTFTLFSDHAIKAMVGHHHAGLPGAHAVAGAPTAAAAGRAA